jgi:hypothetical protein
MELLDDIRMLLNVIPLPTLLFNGTTITTDLKYSSGQV